MSWSPGRQRVFHLILKVSVIMRSIFVSLYYL